MRKKRVLWPIAGFLLGSGLMTALYFGIVSLAEGPEHAAAFFVEELRFILPLILGFGIQSALYLVLKKRLFLPVESIGPSGAMTGAGGTTSTLGMVACCAHHVTDVLPILGLTAAAAFLAEYQMTFMFIGLMTTLIGIGIMVAILLRERNKAAGRSALEHAVKSAEGRPYLPLGLAIAVVGWIALNPLPLKPLTSTQNPDQAPAPQSAPEEVYPQVLEPVSSDTRLWFSGTTLIDQQGSVVVEVTPLHLNQKNNTLYIGVAMNTHSVDLSMDLAKLATLTLEDGAEIFAVHWDGPAGGHHVSGVLSFVLTEEQLDLLLSTDKLQLALVEVDAAERSFVWQEGE